MPKEGEQAYLSELAQAAPRPYVIYADFEAVVIKIQEPQHGNTQKTQHHEVCGFSYIVVRCDGQTEPPVVYRGRDAAQRFLNAMQEEERKIIEVLSKPKPMIMNFQDRQAKKAEKECHVCNKPLVVDTYRDAIDRFDPNTGALEGAAHKTCYFEARITGPTAKYKARSVCQDTCCICKKPLIKRDYRDCVRDHCHITGKYRGAAHNDCNLKFRLDPKTITTLVVFHNLRGYDSHLIMQAISRVEGSISCIPNNMEKYISFSLGQLRFIDSLQFLNASLGSLVSANQPESFLITNQYEPDEEKRRLLLRKGVYPYEHMDIWERFQEERLPPQAAFHSTLTGEGISAKDYDHEQKVWSAFNCRTMGDYHDLYLRTDVLLLADVFETFRKTSLQQYGLDPSNYYSSP